MQSGLQNYRDTQKLLIEAHPDWNKALNASGKLEEKHKMYTHRERFCYSDKTCIALIANIVIVRITIEW